MVSEVLAIRAPALRVSVVFAARRRHVQEVILEMPAGATVGEAVQRSGLLAGVDATVLSACVVGVWGLRCDLRRLLRTHDRVEIYRPLTVDPQEARRQRFVRQGSKRAGLFAKRRPGAKTGY